MTAQSAGWMSMVVVALLGLACLACSPFVLFERWGGARRLRVVIACRVLRRRIPRQLADMPGHPDQLRAADLSTNAEFLRIIAGLHGETRRRFAGTRRHR